MGDWVQRRGGGGGHGVKTSIHTHTLENHKCIKWLGSPFPQQTWKKMSGSQYENSVVLDQLSFYDAG